MTNVLAQTDLGVYSTCIVTAANVATVTGYVTLAATEATNRLTKANSVAYLISGQTLKAVGGTMNFKTTTPTTNLITTVSGTSVSSLSGAKSGANQYTANSAIAASGLALYYLYRKIN
ncbi:hypothetical protein Ciccas_014430 [Cichlidogyrus casuarinus]|uniref:Uncharacterized protein n=1 Tax=Cichlidogyrus casuarinus TaxID=1844966 RepID=A0ABD2PIB5_9PLAT